MAITGGGPEDLRIALQAIDESFTRELNKIIKKIETLEKKTKESAQKQNKAWSKATAGLTKFGRGVSLLGRGFNKLLSPLRSTTTMLLGGGGLVMALYKGTKAAIDFESSLAEVSTLLDGKVGPSMDKYKEALLDMVTTSSKSLNDLTKGLYQTISAGITDTDKAIKVLDLSQKAAVAGLTDVSVAVDGLTTLVNAFQLSTSEADKAADLLFQTVKRGKVVFPELSFNLGKVATMASQAGIRMEEMFAAISTLTKAGLPIDVATTALRQLIANLLDPTEEAKKNLHALGIEFGTAALSGGNFTETLKKIHEKTGGNAEVLTKLIPNIRALQAALVLTGGQVESYTEDLEYMTKSAGAANAAFEKMAETTKEKLAIEWQKIQLILERIGEKAMPIVLDMIRKFANWTEEHLPEIIAGFQAFVDVVSDLANMLRTVLEVATEIMTLGIIDQFGTGAEERVAQRAREREARRIAEAKAGEIIGAGGRTFAESFLQRHKGSEWAFGRVQRERQRLIEEAARLAKEAGTAGGAEARQKYAISDILAQEAHAIDIVIKRYEDLRFSGVKSQADINNETKKLVKSLEKSGKSTDKIRDKINNAKESVISFLEKWKESQLPPLERLRLRYERMRELLKDNYEKQLLLDEWYQKEKTKIVLQEIKRRFDELDRQAKELEKFKTPSGWQKFIGFLSGENQEGLAGKMGYFAVSKLGFLQNPIVANVTQGAAIGAQAGGGYGAAIGAIVGLVATMMDKNAQEFRDAWTSFLDKLENLFTNLNTNIATLLSELIGKLPAIIATALQTLNLYDLLKAIIVDGVYEGFKKAISGAGGFFGDLFGAGGSGKAASAWGTVAGIATGGLSEILNWFHSGGVVGNNSAARAIVALGNAADKLQKAHSGRVISLRRDEVPAILQTGEGVLSRKGMATLAALNRGEGVGGMNVTVNIAPGGWVAAEDASRALDRVVSELVKGGPATAGAVYDKIGRVPGKVYGV